MRKTNPLLFGCVLLLASLPTIPAGATEQHALLLVGHAPGAAAAVVADFPRGTVVQVLPAIHALVLRVELAAPATATLLAHPLVRFVELDAPAVGAASHVPMETNQPPLRQIQAEEAWAVTTGGPQATLCAVDSGVRATHQDLKSRIVGGWDFVQGDDHPQDEHGHGTHVASLAAASVGAGGMDGVSNAPILSARVLDGSGRGSWSNLAAGILWCAENASPRGIVTLSVSGDGYSQAVADAIEYATEAKGLLLIGAAGNRAACAECITFPANLTDVLTVGCTDEFEDVCRVSARGAELDLVAPGSEVTGASHLADDGYVRSSGTSMSVGYVAGVAHLLWSARPDATNDIIRSTLLATAQDLAAPGWDAETGLGEVDAGCALAASCERVSPGPPKDLRAEPGLYVGEVVLRWQPPHQLGASAVQSYVIHRRTDTQPEWREVARVRGFLDWSDGEIPVGTCREYAVRALTRGGLGDGAFASQPISDVVGPGCIMEAH